MPAAQPAPLAHPTETAELAAVWETFLRSQDAHYAQLAAAQGQPYVHLSEEEIALAVQLVAGSGLRPEARASCDALPAC